MQTRHSTAVWKQQPGIHNLSRSRKEKMSAGLVVQRDATCFCSSACILFELRGSHMTRRVCVCTLMCVCQWEYNKVCACVCVLTPLWVCVIPAIHIGIFLLRHMEREALQSIHWLGHPQTSWNNYYVGEGVYISRGGQQHSTMSTTVLCCVCWF